jgi:hypothetical protein
MPTVEVFEGDASAPSFIAEFEFLPRAGEYLSSDAGGYFIYLNVVEVWHRQDGEAGQFKACLRVKQDD